ncbi:hypothetical protein [Nonomuraea endophytica]|uniref:hypothetical protein n=1 Tax=Nonomuraea endophytica TaxID=714136 RepID=UPI0037C9819A
MTHPYDAGRHRDADPGHQDPPWPDPDHQAAPAQQTTPDPDTSRSNALGHRDDTPRSEAGSDTPPSDALGDRDDTPRSEAGSDTSRSDAGSGEWETSGSGQRNSPWHYSGTGHGDLPEAGRPGAAWSGGGAGVEDGPDVWESRPRTRWPGEPEPDVLDDWPGRGHLRMRAVVPVAAGMVVLAGLGAWLGLSGGDPDERPAVATPRISLMEVPGEVVFTPLPSRTPEEPVTSGPAREPSTEPTADAREPTTKPPAQPSAKPSTKPSARPSAKPSAKPSTKPSTKPSAKPSAKASAKPSGKPTAQPSAKPTETPTQKPSPPPQGGEPEPTCDNWVDCHDLPPDM